MSKLFVIMGILLLIVMTGCGGGHPPYQVGKLQADYTVIQLPYNGATITCIKNIESHQGGLSCDWISFYGLDKLVKK